MQMNISFGNLFVASGNYEFAFSRVEFLRAIEHATSTGWLSAYDVSNAISHCGRKGEENDPKV